MILKIHKYTAISPEIQGVLNLCCSLLKITKADLLGSNRKRLLVNARRICGVIFRRKYLLTTSESGVALKKDHSSIVYYLKDHDSLFEVDPEYRHFYKLVEHALGLKDVNEKDQDHVDYLELLLAKLEHLEKTNKDLEKKLQDVNEITNF